MTKSKMMATGGMTKKGYAAGGMTMAMPMKKGYAAGGMMKKGYAAGGVTMPMVEKGGMKVPAFAADGKGKMAKGGAVKAPMAKKK